MEKLKFNSIKKKYLNNRKITNYKPSPVELPNEPNVQYNPTSTPWEGVIYHICISNSINNWHYY